MATKRRNEFWEEFNALMRKYDVRYYAFYARDIKSGLHNATSVAYSEKGPTKEEIIEEAMRCFKK